ncbi:histidine kinase [Nocardiopsis sp. N85]|uniref:sensor histidine kinase n=1 Tax=Nocardiopsis sp. N85 TaxID=3029400 RepID=UPI00237F6CD6|nr:histidine kinase [Nocardiopsis sp. N85]MDE3720691.1 histidine kinase [Nocardiopsis sp. N85]
MALLSSRVPLGHVALAGVVVLAVLAVRWPALVPVLPVPALLTGRLSPDPRPATVVYAVGAFIGAGWLLVGGGPVGLWGTGGILLLFAVLMPWLVGSYLRVNAVLERSGWERARTLEREARLMAERTRMRERSRIAQDLHDEVGHELSLLALRAGALEMAADLPEERRAAASALREAAARAADRLLEAVGVLRADSGVSAPLGPAGDGVPALVSRARSAGLDVTLAGTTGPLPTLVDRAVHRVTQEALTNATRYASGATVRVLVEEDGDEVRVTVTDSGGTRTDTAGPAPAGRAVQGGGLARGGGPARDGSPTRDGSASGGGTGLTGLDERVRLLGGRLEAGPQGAGWSVHARIPLHGTPRPTAEAFSSPTVDGGRPAPVEGARRRDAAPEAGSDGMGPVAAEEAAHRWARRRTGAAITVLIGVPIAVVLMGYAITVSLAAHQAATAGLDPWVFEELRPGRDRSEVEALLPERDLYQGPLHDTGSPPPDPAGLECRHYRVGTDVFGEGYGRYRLCFDTETLVSAEVW